VVRGFASAIYWSSTENNANNAWNQNFSGGGQNNDNKNNNQRVRLHEDKAYLTSLIPLLSQFLGDKLRLDLHPRKMHLQHLFSPQTG
jgi:hypothetical protein